MKMLAYLVCGCLLTGAAQAVELDQVAQRRDADFAAGRPLVAHVVVALCDNVHQGIVPVPAALGDGANPQANLYWGARYGVRTWFQRSTGWKSVPIAPSGNSRVLDRVLFRGEVTRDGTQGEVYLLAEAWNGQYIQDAIRYFLELNRGEHAQILRAGERDLEVGGRSHVIAFVGHNGLMDFAAPKLPSSPVKPPPHAGVVLACMSDSYFTPLLGEHALPLLMTSGLMAPEAYTLDAALMAWFSGKSTDAVQRAAAGAYAHHQRTSERATSRLFRTPKTSVHP
jgi:hypothetical protein